MDNFILVTNMWSGMIELVNFTLLFVILLCSIKEKHLIKRETTIFHIGIAIILLSIGIFYDHNTITMNQFRYLGECNTVSEMFLMFLFYHF